MCFVAASFALRIVSLQFFGLFLTLSILFGVCLTTPSVLLEQLSFRRRPKISELLSIVTVSYAENLSYRQLDL